MKRRHFTNQFPLLITSFIIPKTINKQLQRSIRDRLLQDMINIPAGSFIMGADEGQTIWQPRHTRYLPDYRIMRRKIQWKDWFEYAQMIGKPLPPRPQTGEPTWGDNEEVRLVSFNDAIEFAQWVGLDLPAESEWEKAARGTDGQKYSWGNEWDHTKLGLTNSMDWDTSPYGMTQICRSLVGEWTKSVPTPYPGQILNSYLQELYSIIEDDHYIIRGGLAGEG